MRCCGTSPIDVPATALVREGTACCGFRRAHGCVLPAGRLVRGGQHRGLAREQRGQPRARHRGCQGGIRCGAAGAQVHARHGRHQGLIWLSKPEITGRPWRMHACMHARRPRPAALTGGYDPALSTNHGGSTWSGCFATACRCYAHKGRYHLSLIWVMMLPSVGILVVLTCRLQCAHWGATPQDQPARCSCTLKATCRQGASSFLTVSPMQRPTLCCAQPAVCLSRCVMEFALQTMQERRQATRSREVCQGTDRSDCELFAGCKGLVSVRCAAFLSCTGGSATTRDQHMGTHILGKHASPSHRNA